MRAVALGGVPPAPLPPRRRWGFVNTAKHRAYRAEGIDLRLYVGDEDMTGLCRWFDDTGKDIHAELYLLNEHGHKYMIEASHAATRRVFGPHVRIEVLEWRA